MKKIGIIGYGEIGSSLHQLYEDFTDKFEVLIFDPSKNYEDDLRHCDIINICIPYNEDFNNNVSDYIVINQPDLTIIHSTVAVGTTKWLSDNGKYNVVHSPVRGVHPNLYGGLKTFKKYIASNNDEAIEICYNHFSDLQLYYGVIRDPNVTELQKLLSTTYYGLIIAWHDNMKKIADKHNVDFRHIGDWTQSYNEGYRELRKPDVIRPNLYPPEGKIGGHCVIPNTELLKSVFDNVDLDSKLLDIILEYK